jgi:fatty-acid desaturase
MEPLGVFLGQLIVCMLFNTLIFSINWAIAQITESDFIKDSFKSYANYWEYMIFTAFFFSAGCMVGNTLGGIIGLGIGIFVYFVFIKRSTNELP